MQVILENKDNPPKSNTKKVLIIVDSVLFTLIIISVIIFIYFNLKGKRTYLNEEVMKTSFKDEDQFNSAWENLNESIKKYNLINASILIQEMITNSNEVIIGLNTDSNFGKIMLFGTGGIYTEVLDDISIRILPANDFEEMIKETKIGKILNGVRGEEPKAIKKTIDVLNKVQKSAFDLPEINSIDINPILITKDRAIVVDFKILLK